MPAVVETDNIAYEASNPWRAGPETLDVYAPSAGGTYPVVVMFHGSPQTNTKSTLTPQALAVAKLGAVVFMPNWGHFGQAWPDYERAVYTAGQVACAVAFARMHAAEYGGDPSRMVVFGHSGGGSVAVGSSFNRDAPSADCPGGTELGDINALAAWDPDWLSMDPGWDELIVNDPRLYRGTPWQHIAEHPDLRVAMVTDGIVGPYVRDLSKPGAADAFFAPRDPNGDLRQLIEQMGLLDDGKFDLVEMQRFAAEFLRHQGNPVTLDVMPGTTHDAMSPEGAIVFADVFERLLPEV